MLTFWQVLPMPSSTFTTCLLDIRTFNHAMGMEVR
jgi:hypothetical protein